MSWDIATDLGSTALAVAARRAAETAQDDPLIHDEFAAVLVAAANEPGWQRMACGDLSWMGERTMLGGALRERGASTSPHGRSSSTSSVLTQRV